MFNIRLKELRKTRGIKRKDICTAINLGEKNYYNLEHKNSKPSYDTLIALADYFEVSIDYLVGRTDNPEINR